MNRRPGAETPVATAFHYSVGRHFGAAAVLRRMDIPPADDLTGRVRTAVVCSMGLCNCLHV